MKAMRDRRIELGLTQMKLAQDSRTSLPNLQRIETGRANPSFETLQALASVLGLQLLLDTEEANWEALAALGVPLERDSDRSHRLSSESLVKELRLACLEITKLSKSNRGGDFLRKKDAVRATLLALKHHYPSFYSEHFGRSPLVDRVFPKKISGRLVKLRRVALSRISIYL